MERQWDGWSRRIKGELSLSVLAASDSSLWESLLKGTGFSFHLSTFPSFKHPSHSLIWTSISTSLFSPYTPLNSLISGIQCCLTELARCPCQIKHLYQEQIVSSLLPFQLCVFFPQTNQVLPWHIFCAWVRAGFTITCWCITIPATYSFSQCFFSLA